MHRRQFVSRAARAVAAFGILRHVAACRSVRAGSETSPFEDLRDRYFLRVLELYPTTATYLGGDGYAASLAGINGRLRDYRAPAIVAEVRFYHDVDRELAAIERARLTDADRIDHDVLRAQIAFLVRQLAERRYQERSVDTYVAEPFRGVDWQIQQMTPEGQRLGTESEWRMVVERVGAVPAFVDAAEANLLVGVERGNVPDRRMVRRDGIDGSAANAKYFRATLIEIARRSIGNRAFGATLLRQLGRAGDAAATAYERFGRFLAATYDLHERADRYAVGSAEYDWRLRHCLRVDRNAASLFEYGAEQVALYEARMFAVAAEVAADLGLSLPFGGDAEQRASTAAVIDRLSADSPANDEELLRWYRDTGVRAVAYGRDQHLFDVPADYRLDVVPTPPVLRSTIDAAYYPAPPLKHTGVGRFYLTPTGNDAAALRQNNRASVADTAVHEGFPGHDWHYKYMARHAAEISNIRWLTPGAVEDSSSMWEDSMATEGWGLYSEELMAEPLPDRPHGFYSAAEHLYELQGQLLRAVRVRVDVGLHTGRMSYDEAVNYFTAHVYLMPDACARASSDPAARVACESAQRAVYRYSKWPTQAITYNLGKGEIVALREAVRARQGDRFSAQSFHEHLMRMGTIPAGYFRSTFLG